jgi:hypothetical protein
MSGAIQFDCILHHSTSFPSSTLILKASGRLPMLIAIIVSQALAMTPVGSSTNEHFATLEMF